MNTYGNYYPEELIERVADANDIVDVIGQYVSLKKSGGRYWGLCPFHNEKTPSFSVSEDRQLFYCFGCHAGGSVFTFLEKYNDITFPEAVRELAGRAGIPLPEREMSREERQKADRRSALLAANRDAAVYFYRLLRSPRGQKALAYFKKRGLSDETMQKFGLGYADLYSDDLCRYLRKKDYSDELLRDAGLVRIDEKHGVRDAFWNRAMFPIMDINGRVIAFGGRIMGDAKAMHVGKYVNTSDTKIFDKSRTVYGLHLARKSRRREREGLILCEGYMDVIALHQAGFDNACASLGTALTGGHANLLRRYTDRVLLSYDSDGAGVAATLRAIPILRSAGITARVVSMAPYKDPDEFIGALGAEEYEKRIASAANAITFTVEQISKKYNISDPEEKTRFLEEAADVLLEVPEAVTRSEYLKKIAAAYSVRTQDLEALVKKRAAGRKMKGSRRDGVYSAAGVPGETLLESGGETAAPDGPEGSRRQPRGRAMLAHAEAEHQRLVLNWLSLSPKLYPEAAAYLSPEDFDEGVFRQAAEEIFHELETDGEVHQVKVVSMFSDVSDQETVGRIFHTTARSDETDEDRREGLNEQMIHILENHKRRLSGGGQAADPESFQKVLELQHKIERLKKQSRT